MKTTHARRCGLAATALLTAVTLGGCGGSDAPDASADAGRPLPTASIPRDSTASTGEPKAIAAGDARPVPEQGSPEWLLEEIVRIRIEPFPKETDLKKITEVQAQRNRRIVGLASEAVQQTHGDPDRKASFATAVRHLLEARLQLALHGDRDHIDALYEDAESLFKRSPKSEEAAAAAFTVARFAHANARRFAQKEPRWIEEFARQAKHFAEHFPQDEPQAAPLLFAAAQSCELNGLNDEAKVCYALLQERFPENAQGQAAVAVLRRLELPGNPLELSGPTIDGGQVDMEDYRGRAVLVVFWSTTASGFTEKIETVRQAIAGHPPESLVVVGVNLDEDESAIDAFLEQHFVDRAERADASGAAPEASRERRRLPWKHIFYAQPDQRGWENPIVQRFGVHEIPQFWLVDRQGNVISIDLEPENLAEAIAQAVGVPR
ncbi:MAG: TlpA disulfide reductase family protein [Planctomycetaceae bacterium]